MIILTGASGFIGRHLAKKLSDDGYRLFLCSHTRDISRLFPKTKAVRLNLAKKRDIKKLPTRGVEAVYHLASFVPQSVSKEAIGNVKKYLHANLIATMNVLEYCRTNHIKKLVYVSTVSVYGYTDTPPKEENPAYPLNFYGWSKLAAEILCEKYRRNFGIDCFSLRLSSVYGVGQSPYSVLAKFVKNAIEGRKIIIWGTGEKVIDFVYIKDVVSANICALKSKRPGIYNIGSGRSTSIVDLAEATVNIFSEKRIPILFDRRQKEDTSPVWLDITKAENSLGYQPKYPLVKGLKDYRRGLKL